MTRIHIAIVFHFAPDYFQPFERALRAYADFAPWDIVLHILTNTDEKNERDEILAVCAKHLSTTADVKIHAFASLEDPFLLTWTHKKILEEEFFSDPEGDLFIYAEHDIVVTRRTVEHFLSAREVLRPEGLLPGFVRFENAETGGLNIVDFRSVFRLAAQKLRIFDGKRYALDYPPYCAFFILDRELAEQHMRSLAFREEGSREISTMEVRERAAIGELFSRVPKGRAHRYALLLDEHYRPDEAAQVWHATNNYSSNPRSTHGKIPMSKSVSPTLLSRLKARLQG